ncbi:hypothetical protein pb186bvf_000273 [Paramecium bursaria]
MQLWFNYLTPFIKIKWLSYIRNLFEQLLELERTSYVLQKNYKKLKISQHSMSQKKKNSSKQRQVMEIEEDLSKYEQNSKDVKGNQFEKEQRCENQQVKQKQNYQVNARQEQNQMIQEKIDVQTNIEQKLVQQHVEQSGVEEIFRAINIPDEGPPTPHRQSIKRTYHGCYIHGITKNKNQIQDETMFQYQC